jgi:hypothetical protein
MVAERERVICVTLSERDWQAFVARHPEPVQWLRARIAGEIAELSASTVPDASILRVSGGTTAA